MTDGAFLNVTTPTYNATTAATITTTEIWVQLVLFYFLFAFVLATTGNIAITAGIYRSKKLRSRFFVFVGSLTVARIILGSQLLVLFIYRSLRTLGIAQTNLRTPICFAIHIHLTYVTTLEMILLLCLLLDRVMAVMAYNYYRNLTNRQALILTMAVYIGTILFKLVPSFFGIDFGQSVPCLTAYSSTNAAYNVYSLNIDLALALLIMVLYIAFLAYLRYYKLPSLKKAASNDVAGHAGLIALNRQMKLMPLLRRLVLIHCSLALIGKFILSLASTMPAVYSQRFVVYGSSLVTVDLLANAIMLLTSRKDLRKASLSCFSKPTKTVTVKAIAKQGANNVSTNRNATGHKQ